MTTHKLKTTDGRDLEVSIPAPGNIPSFFIFSLPKSGSTLLMNMLTDVCQIKNIPVVDLATEIFNQGIPPTTLLPDINEIWKKQGYAYLGFRSFFPAIEFDFTQTKNILLIRDPRDMLVSLYFSLKYSHVEPTGAGKNNSIRQNRERLKDSDINQSILSMSHSYKTYFNDYISKLPVATTRVYRYEDVIFKKKEWLADILAFLNIKINESQIDSISDKYDIRPEKEDPHRHVRQVVPGNYKLHLRKDTIQELDNMFRCIMNYFQYDSVVKMSLSSQLNQKVLHQETKSENELIELSTNLRNELDTVLNSRSWRITLPLRKLSSFLRGAIKG